MVAGEKKRGSNLSLGGAGWVILCLVCLCVYVCVCVCVCVCKRERSFLVFSFYVQAFEKRSRLSYALNVEKMAD